MHLELDSGIRSSGTYTVQQAVDDWLREGLDGRSGRTRTLSEGLLRSLIEVIGSRPLRDLSAGDVRSALAGLPPRLSTRSLQIDRNSLERTIAFAQAGDLVGRNVAALVKSPRGRAGRPSKSFTLEQARAVLGRRRVCAGTGCNAEFAGWHPDGGGAGAAVGSRGGLGGRCDWLAVGDRGGVRPGAGGLGAAGDAAHVRVGAVRS